MSKRHSIRFRLTAWFMGISALVLLLTGGLVLVIFRNNLLAEARQSLRDKSFVMGAWADLSDGEVEADIRDYVRSQEATLLVQAFDRQGQVWGADTIHAVHLQLPESVRRQVLAEDEAVYYGDAAFAGPLVANHLYDGDQVAGFVVLGLRNHDIYAPARLLLGWLAMGLGLGLVLAYGGSILFLRQILGPLREISGQAAGFQASHLTGERLPVPNPEDEIGQLSQTINGLLDRLEVAFVAQRRLVADAAHELRTPLAVLKGRLEVATMKGSIGPRELATLQEQVEQLIRLTNGLLDLARADAGDVQEAAGVLRLDQFLEARLAALAAGPATGQVTLRTGTLSPSTVCLDPFWLERILDNLLDNAVKFNRPGGWVRVSCWQKDGEATLEVADNGRGIRAENLARVFDRFYRGEQTGDKVPGTGLGLGLVRSLVDAQGGRVEASSEWGQGATFKIHWPAVSDGAPAAP